MKARAAVSAVVSLVLALAPGAQAAVVEGRISIGELGGVHGLPLQIGAPALTGTLFAAPSLEALNAAPAPALIPVVAAAAVPVELHPVAVALAAKPLGALAARIQPAALRTERPADAINQRFAELRAAFDEKKPQDVPVEGLSTPGPRDGLTPSTDAGPTRGNEPPQPPRKPRAGLFGISRPLIFFLLAMIVAQVGIEAQTAALPPLIAKVFGNVSIAADVGMAASLAELAGTIAAPIAAKKLGLKEAYVWSTALRVATGGLLAGFLAVNAMSVAGLVALMAVDALLLGLSLTTEKSIPAVMLDQDQGKLEKFKAARQTMIEAVATVVPIATGIAVSYLGFIPALVAFPLALAVSAGLVALTLKLPGRISGLDGHGLPGPGEGSLLSYARHLWDGTKAIATTPALLFSVLTYSLVYVPISLVYWIMAPAYALHLAGPGHEALATAYSGMITGLYSLGGILAGLWLMRQQRKPRTEAAMRGSMLRWTTACALMMLAFAALAVPTGVLWGTLTLPALALLLFGFPQVIAKLKLESYFQSNAPEGAIADATAVLESASSIFILAGLWIFGKLLAGAAIVSLAHLALAVGPMIALLLLLTWALARASRAGAA